MDAETADWIWWNAVPPLVRRGAGGEPDRTCPCQYGPCGHCQAGRHTQCVMLKRTAIAWPEAFIIDRHGMVTDPTLGMWRADGPPCRWICPCPAEHRGLLPDLKPGTGRARPATPAELATDRRRAVPATAPLFELPVGGG